MNTIRMYTAYLDMCGLSSGWKASNINEVDSSWRSIPCSKLASDEHAGVLHDRNPRFGCRGYSTFSESWCRSDIGAARQNENSKALQQDLQS